VHRKAIAALVLIVFLLVLKILDLQASLRQAWDLNREQEIKQFEQCSEQIRLIQKLGLKEYDRDANIRRMPGGELRLKKTE
jgi:hypothetical protein